MILAITTFGSTIVQGQSTIVSDLKNYVSKSEFSEGLNTAETTSITITDVMIPVSDTVELHGRLYKPDSIEDKLPTIFAMTPYTLSEFDAHAYGRYFASRGYVYLNVDVRGRGASDGIFRPLTQDGPDGAAVARWIASQPWSDGQVAMRGGSYHGMVQWQILAEETGSIRTIVPTASVYPGWDFPNSSGILETYAAQWLSAVSGRAIHLSLGFDNKYWDGKDQKLHQKGEAFEEYDDIADLSLRTDKIFNRWIKHPHFDNYWRAANPDPADYQRLDLPILTITGHFDADQPGALRYYRQHMEHGSKEGTKRHYLVIGPWDHMGTRHPEKKMDGLTFSENAVIDMNGLHREWFDWIMKDGSKPSMLDDLVVYYVMESDQWRSAPSLREVADTNRTFYLQSPGKNPDDPFDAGEMSSKPPSEKEVDQYVYDPREKADIARLDAITKSKTSPGAAYLEGPKLIYHSPPVQERFELTGQMQFDAWIELGVPDTDIAVWVYEIRQTGKTIYLGQTERRARHRMGVDTSKLVEPGTVQKYQFDRFDWTARQIQKGSRIRLVIAPYNVPGIQKNYNSGGPPMKESVEDARTATVKLHIGPAHPSKLILPVRTGDDHQ